MTIADEEDDEGEEDSDRVRSGFALLLNFDVAMNSQVKYLLRSWINSQKSREIFSSLL